MEESIESETKHSKKTFRNINLEKRRLQEVFFRDCEFERVDFQFCLLREACFQDVSMKHAVFDKCDLQNCQFANADLSHADMTTARNYFVNSQSNKLHKTKFSLPEALSLLGNFDIILS